MRCYAHGCRAGALSDVLLVHVWDSGLTSREVWEPLCLGHESAARAGLYVVGGTVRRVRVLGSRPVREHEHDFRVFVGNAPRDVLTGSCPPRYRMCPCGELVYEVERVIDDRQPDMLG